MKINWHQNPLCSAVELSADEKEIFLLKAEIQHLQEDVIGMAKFVLDPNGGYYNPEEALSYLSTGKPDFGYMLDNLSGWHVGDCTAVAASCPKCYAEEILGINTIAGLGKHGGARLSRAYRADADISDVISSLANNPNAKHTHDWLVRYRDAHFAGRQALAESEVET